MKTATGPAVPFSTVRAILSPPDPCQETRTSSCVSKLTPAASFVRSFSSGLVYATAATESYRLLFVGSVGSSAQPASDASPQAAAPARTTHSAFFGTTK